jgi:hypothetical protein
LALGGALTSEKVEQSADGRKQAPPRREHRMDDAAARLPLRQDMDKTPGADVFPDDDSRKLHDADAGQRRLAQHRYVVGDKAGAVRDQCRLAVLMIELPLMIAARRAEIEAGKPAQIAG